MARYIDADRLKKWWNDRYNVLDTIGVNQAISAIENAPTANVAPVMYGEWTGNWVSTDEDLDGYFDGYKCVACDEQNETRTRFCPNCGAKMNSLPIKE